MLRPVRALFAPAAVAAVVRHRLARGGRPPAIDVTVVPARPPAWRMCGTVDTARAPLVLRWVCTIS